MPADVTSIPVEFLFTMVANLSAPTMAGAGPKGTRVIVGVTGGSVKGPKVSGDLLPPGGDWIHAGADGTLTLDVRALIKTDDGAVILMTYSGKGVNGDIRTAPTFETGDERYAWLNNVQAVSTGAIVDGGAAVAYEVYRVL